MFSHKEPIKTEYMNARELFKEVLNEKLNDMSKEELVDIVANIALKTIFSRLLIGSLRSETQFSELINSINTDVQSLNPLEKQIVDSNLFVSKEMLKDSGLFTQNCKRNHK